ncbi:hypothetical protein K439DRAFT_1661746 [Ramaria rubella]|nr:hypothetical protein K439DRAFT_1661746 [Ramaria rubella]
MKKPQQCQMVEPVEHNYYSDGLLDVNPKDKHPIFQLIKCAEMQWKRKLQRQNKTLMEAVAEYQRWDYVKFHKVKLVDEYYSKRISPFALLAAQTKWEAKPDIPCATHVMLFNATIPGLSINQLALLSEVQECLRFAQRLRLTTGPLIS